MKFDSEELRKAALPLMQWLADNCHPHCKIIVDSEHMELLEGLATARREQRNKEDEKMTDEQINKAIALHLGWTGVVSDSILGVIGIPPARNECDISRPSNAIWTKDLNSMHEAEQQLSPHQRDQMRMRLNMTLGTEYWSATARQRAEAFLRTLGKWEEAK